MRPTYAGTGLLSSLLHEHPDFKAQGLGLRGGRREGFHVDSHKNPNPDFASNRRQTTVVALWLHQPGKWSYDIWQLS